MLSASVSAWCRPFIVTASLSVLRHGNEGYVSARRQQFCADELHHRTPGNVLLPDAASTYQLWSSWFADGRDIVDFHDLMSPSFRQIFSAGAHYPLRASGAIRRR
jgi:hypothetical protein